jgi:hypothetical protein
MKNKIILSTQYYENYNVGPEGFGEVPFWKPKGEVQFQIEMDTDIILYCDEVNKIFSKMVEKHNTIAEKFEYIGYEIQWHEPHLLGTEDEFLAHLETINQTTI